MSVSKEEAAKLKAEKLEKDILWAKYNYRSAAKAASDAIGHGSLTEAKDAIHKCDAAYASLRRLIGVDAAKAFARTPWRDEL